ncbi:hypothetical protein ACFX2J_034399 [Malus domestica]
MSPFTLHCKADIHSLPSSPRMPFQQTLSSHSVVLIPWGTSANNSSKAKEKESNQPALGINLPIWNQLPGTPS